MRVISFTLSWTLIRDSIRKDTSTIRCPDGVFMIDMEQMSSCRLVHGSYDDGILVLSSLIGVSVINKSSDLYMN